MSVGSWFTRILGVGRAAESAVDTAERVSAIVAEWVPSNASEERIKLALIELARMVASHRSPVVAVGVGWLYFVAGTILGTCAVGPWVVGSAAWLMRIAPDAPAGPDPYYGYVLIGLLFGVKTSDLIARKIGK